MNLARLNFWKFWNTKAPTSLSEISRLLTFWAVPVLVKCTIFLHILYCASGSFSVLQIELIFCLSFASYSCKVVLCIVVNFKVCNVQVKLWASCDSLNQVDEVAAILKEILFKNQHSVLGEVFFVCLFVLFLFFFLGNHCLGNIKLCEFTHATITQDPFWKKNESLASYM